MERFNPEYLNPGSVSMGSRTDGKYVRYDDLPWWYRMALEGSRKLQEAFKRLEARWVAKLNKDWF